MITPNYERDGSTYSEAEMRRIVANEILHMRKVATGRKAIAISLSEIETSRNVLDVGSEIGTFLVALKEKAMQTTNFFGVDVNEKSHRIAIDFCQQDRVSFQEISSEKLPFESGKFDRVFALEVLEHLRNVEVSLKEIHRVMCKGGLFLISVPNATSIRSLAKIFLLSPENLAEKIESWPKFAPDQRDHVNNYDFLHLYRILNLCGFKYKKLNTRDGSFLGLEKFQ